MSVYNPIVRCYSSCFFFLRRLPLFFFFFFNDTATTEIYTLSLHDALPISHVDWLPISDGRRSTIVSLFSPLPNAAAIDARDRKSTRLNSSHQIISYAVFCLKKKKKCEKTTA